MIWPLCNSVTASCITLAWVPASQTCWPGRALSRLVSSMCVHMWCPLPALPSPGCADILSFFSVTKTHTPSPQWLTLILQVSAATSPGSFPRCSGPGLVLDLWPCSWSLFTFLFRASIHPAVLRVCAPPRGLYPIPEKEQELMALFSMASLALLVTCCCITNYHNSSSIKSTHLLPQFLWVRSLSVTQLGPLLEGPQSHKVSVQAGVSWKGTVGIDAHITAGRIQFSLLCSASTTPFLAPWASP